MGDGLGDGLGSAAHGRTRRRALSLLGWIVAGASLACAASAPPPPPPVPAPEPPPAAAPEAAPAAEGTDPAPGELSTPPPPGREPGGDVLALSSDELFYAGSAELTEAGRARLHAVAAELSSRGPVLLVVRAHTDDDGSVAFNYALSDERAETVRLELVAAGLDGASIRARGLGPRYPIAPNDTPEGRARNRRVTLETRAPAWRPSGVLP